MSKLLNGDASPVNLNDGAEIYQPSNQPQPKVRNLIQVYRPIDEIFYSGVITQIDNNGKHQNNNDDCDKAIINSDKEK